MLVNTWRKCRRTKRRSLIKNAGHSAGAGGACCGEIVTATGEGDTESSTCGCEPSSADGFEIDVTLLPRRPAPTTVAASAKATRPTRLDRRGVFLLWEVGSCSDTLPEL